MQDWLACFVFYAHANCVIWTSYVLAIEQTLSVVLQIHDLHRWQPKKKTEAYFNNSWYIFFNFTKFCQFVQLYLIAVCLFIHSSTHLFGCLQHLYFQVQGQGHMVHLKFWSCPPSGFMSIWQIHLIFGTIITHGVKICRTPYQGQKVKGHTSHRKFLLYPLCGPCLCTKGCRSF